MLRSHLTPRPLNEGVVKALSPPAQTHPDGPAPQHFKLLCSGNLAVPVDMVKLQPTPLAKRSSRWPNLPKADAQGRGVPGAQARNPLLAEAVALAGLWTVPGRRR
jgi:hypothetical protein